VVYRNLDALIEKLNVGYLNLIDHAAVAQRHQKSTIRSSFHQSHFVKFKKIFPIWFVRTKRINEVKSG